MHVDFFLHKDTLTSGHLHPNNQVAALIQCDGSIVTLYLDSPDHLIRLGAELERRGRELAGEAMKAKETSNAN
jgi:hypothetical protein